MPGRPHSPVVLSCTKQSIVLIPVDVLADCQRSGSTPGQGPTAAPHSLQVTWLLSEKCPYKLRCLLVPLIYIVLMTRLVLILNESNPDDSC